LNGLSPAYVTQSTPAATNMKGFKNYQHNFVVEFLENVKNSHFLMFLTFSVNFDISHKISSFSWSTRKLLKLLMVVMSHIRL